MTQELNPKLKTKLTPVRYPGGKSNALKKLNSEILKNIKFEEYREPFFGGGSVGLYLMQTHKTAKYWINDLFYPVYCFWKVIYTNPDVMIENIFKEKNSIKGDESVRHKSDGGKFPSIRAVNGKELHNKCREEIKKSIDNKNEMETACWWYILNKTSYSGMAMIGSYAPLAWDQNFGDKCIRNLKNTYNLMKSIENPIKITNLDYSELLREDGKNVFIFLDPPYEISHNLYGENGDIHREFNHKIFAEEVEKCKYKWMITYNDNPEIVKRFEKYFQLPWDLTYTMKATIRLDKDKANIKAKIKDGEKEREHNQTDKCGKKGKELLIWNWDREIKL